MGWDEVTFKHWRSFYSVPLSRRRRFGLMYIFIMRWFSLLFAFIIVAANVIFSLTALFGRRMALPVAIDHIQYASFCLYITMICFTFLQALLHECRWFLMIGLTMFFCF